jgi:hypothetical protein
MEGRKPAPIEPPIYADLEPGPLGAIVCTYAVAGIGKVTIEAHDGKPTLQINSEIAPPVFFVGQDQLYVPGPDVRIGSATPRSSRSDSSPGTPSSM